MPDMYTAKQLINYTGCIHISKRILFSPDHRLKKQAYIVSISVSHSVTDVGIQN